MTEPTDATDFADKLSRVLTREIDDFSALMSCQQLSAGASQETYCLTYKTTGSSKRLALRRSQPTATSGSSVGGISLETEAQLFDVAERHGIPGPKIHYVLTPQDGLGSGFIMQWLDGETLGQRITHSDELATIRPQLASQCGRILGELHGIELESSLQQSLPRVTPAILVQETWAHYQALDEPVPMIDYCWRWLRENLPQDSRTTLVHGDFRNGNLMVTPEGINAVLDWELAHVGDPVRDLGWLCVNSWRFGNSSLPVGGFGEIDALLTAYEASSGIEVSADALRFWQVFGSFWWAMATLQMANAWRTGETPSLERPVIGRRSSEAQMDCVNLLIPGDISLPELKTLDQGTQLPMPAELLEGVRQFLKNQVAEDTEPHTAFLARVAANSLGMAQRELQYGAELQAAELTRLQALLGLQDNLDAMRRELVSQLRDGLDLETPGLARHLRQTVAGQLFIDQPRYSGLQGQP